MSRYIMGFIVIALFLGAGYYFGVPFYEKWKIDRAEAARKEQKIKTETAILQAEAELKNYCSSIDVEVIKDSAHDVDGGTDAHAHATATIKAPKGYFIMADSVQTEKTGTRGFRDDDLLPQPVDELKNSPIKQVALKSVSYTVNSRDIGRGGDAHAESIAIVIGKLMPLKCLKVYLDDAGNNL